MRLSSRSATLTACLGLSLALAACSPSGFGRGTQVSSLPQPTQSPPVVTSSVQASDLPPIGSSALPQPTTSGTGNPGTGMFDPATGPASGTGTQLTTLGDFSTTATTAGGRDLSGALSIEKLLGGWTITAGGTQCRLNLTYTAKGATGRYRASTPACAQETLAGVTSWQLLGNQVQLYNEADQLVGTLFKTDNRFVGTLAGGLQVSMEG